MIGLPLRLLAREVYNKVVDKVGAEAGRAHHRRGEDQAAQCALLGLAPSRPCRAISTSPSSRSTKSSSAPISSAAMSSPTACSIAAPARKRWCSAPPPCGRWSKSFCPAPISSAARGSPQLTYSGEKKLTRLPRRSAIVAFSADEVYAIAELIRRQRGGAAVVLGALSPRTRNAQVALYQNGDVDYLVATDAIGMGLNLDVDHVAFAADRKFDGYQFRKLTPGRARPDRRPRRPRHPRRHVRHHRALRSVRAGTGACAGKPRFRAGAHVAMAQLRARFCIDRRLAGFACRDAARAGADPRADRRRHPGAGSRCARRGCARHGDTTARRWSGFGTSARCRTTARSRRPRMPNWRSPSMDS